MVYVLSQIAVLGKSDSNLDKLILFKLNLVVLKSHI